MSKTNFPWLLRMAWRDSRRNRGRLLLFISSIVIGIAALVAINSFGENLQNDINRQARTLLGADLEIEMTQPPSDSLEMMMDSLGGERSSAVSFVSMVYFPKADGTRLAYVRALEGQFPFYGVLSTEPPVTSEILNTGRKAIVDRSLLLQFGIAVGDSIKVGQVTFLIAAELRSAPGQSGVASSIAPVVFIPQQYLEETGLVQRGSRIEYAYYFKLPEDLDVEARMESHEEILSAERARYDTVEERKEEVGEAFANLNTFLNLVGFIALLLGCIGVASAVNIYIKNKLSTVAILRCLGASGRQAFLIYLLQIAVMGLGGAILGAILGSLLQLVLPLVLADFLPLENVSTSVSTIAVVQGIITGLAIALLFALLPLLEIRRTSPLRALNASYETGSSTRDPLRWAVVAAIFLFVAGFTFFQTGGGMEALVFPLALAAAFALLAGVSRLLIWAVRKFFPTSWSYIWRQSLANLFRPNNQTLILMVSIGLGTALLSTLFFTQDLLLDQVKLTGSGERPNMILFDIQTPQKEAVAELAVENDLPLIQEVPIVTMRLESINGQTKADLDADTTSQIPGWVYNREYRVTYRDTLIDSEEITAGQWYGQKQEGKIYVSIAQNIAEDMQVAPGDTLIFNVQGNRLETEVGSIREVDFARLQTNFLVLFPAGVLENAPQFHVIVTRTDSTAQSARFQQQLVKTFPNVSVIDLTQVLQTVDDVLGKVSFVIQFMALFSILTGILVLISSVILSKYQRIRESVLLRTIGASRRQILWINALEYLVLGSIAAFTGILLSIAGSWALAYFQLEIPYRPNWWPPLYTLLIITALTVIIGLINTREVVSKPPLEVLRQEV